MHKSKKKVSEMPVFYSIHLEMLSSTKRGLLDRSKNFLHLS